jgi:hypothetical protein
MCTEESTSGTGQTWRKRMSAPFVGSSCWSAGRAPSATTSCLEPGVLTSCVRILPSSRVGSFGHGALVPARSMGRQNQHRSTGCERIEGNEAIALCAPTVNSSAGQSGSPAPAATPSCQRQQPEKLHAGVVWRPPRRTHQHAGPHRSGRPSVRGNERAERHCWWRVLT